MRWSHVGCTQEAVGVRRDRCHDPARRDLQQLVGVQPRHVDIAGAIVENHVVEKGTAYLGPDVAVPALPSGLIGIRRILSPLEVYTALSNTLTPSGSPRIGFVAPDVQSSASHRRA